MQKRFRSKSTIPKISLWSIDGDKTFNVLLFDSIPLEYMPQYKAHQKNHFVLSYCLEGSFKSFIDFKEHLITKGDAGLINPNQIHFVRPINKKAVKVIVIAFNQAFCARLLLSAKVRMLINAPDENLLVHGLIYHEDIMALLFRSILKEFEGQQKPTPVVFQLMAVLLAKLCEQSKTRKEMPKTSHLYYSFLNLLDEKISKTHRVSEYAKDLEISEKTLSRACQATTQSSAQSIIHQKINFEAKRQLAHNQSSAKEIAYSVGFTDPIQFSKFFKQHNGIAPLAYRKRVRGGLLS
ncbi:MAG: AraC family transcriptional regulator [Cyclobacteriaceae bacterium]|nr:AraC family transcriptional regulator [Cyclobacteriaceae bacterium]